MNASVCALVCMLSVCSALICPDGGMCDDGNTCCEMPWGGYGCCPLPNAECCSDHLHCCNEGTVCDMERGKCVNKTHTLDWVRRVNAKQATIPQAVVCPDQKSECPDDMTCCQMPDGTWGCCPMPDAVCCEDKRHCCPRDTVCDLIHSKCASTTLGSSPFLKKFPAVRKAEKKVICEDQVSMCPDASSCCTLLNGSYGCCPMPNAVCCDHMHCCPEGTVCNLELSTCIYVNKAIKVLALPNPLHPANQKCDSVFSCSDDATCCRTASGGWGCCPLPQAVCCEDHLHCCPHDTVCNVAAEMCVSDLLTVPWVSKSPAMAFVPENERCDEISECPSGTTCCKEKSGKWGCCLLAQVVCCDDHEHCCPQGYKCDIAHESCDHPSLPSMPWVKKQPALSVMRGSFAKSSAEAELGLQHRYRCDAQTTCPRGNSCCYMGKLGKWGCCPLQQAVCCGDGDHCCPSGYTCDEEKPVCTRGNLQIPWFKKQPAMSIQGSEVTPVDVKCDNTTSCAAGTTCCKLSSGKWGCCPLVKAVCCEDHEHCCPHDYTCDLQSGTCVKPSTTHTPLFALGHTSSNHDEGEVRCDEMSRCSKSHTCCRISDTEWACCPFDQAVCCKDTKHCCPKGYTCDLEKRCTKVSSLTWWDNLL